MYFEHDGSCCSSLLRRFFEHEIFSYFECANTKVSDTKKRKKMLSEGQLYSLPTHGSRQRCHTLGIVYFWSNSKGYGQCYCYGILATSRIFECLFSCHLPQLMVSDSPDVRCSTMSGWPGGSHPGSCSWHVSSPLNCTWTSPPSTLAWTMALL